jgi:hypothetical protein
VLAPIDLTGTSFVETSILILLRATLQPGHIAVNTSLGYPGFFPAPFDARTFASAWASQIRVRGLENRLVQATAAGNNRKSPALDNSEWTGAALRGDLTDPATGKPIAPLRNTLVVENDFRGGPPDWQPGCTATSSSKGGTIAAVGTQV